MQPAEKFAAEVRTIAASTGIIQAIHAYNQAINDNPSDVAYKNEFIKFLQTLNLRIESNTLKSLMTHCLSDPQTQWKDAGKSWYSLLLNDPSFKPFSKLVKIKKYAAFAEKITEAANATFFSDPYFVYGLGRLVVRDVNFERFLTFLRRYMLETRDFSNIPAHIPYVLARYAHRTEYIFFVSDKEKALLEKLNPVERDQVLMACYRPVRNADAVVNPSPAWSNLAEEQISAAKTIDYAATNVTPLTKIDDATSALVKTMYEKYPYPAWENLIPVNTEIEAAALPQGSRILSAGCGTGKEALELAAAYPHAQVLAIDLSATSLAYAQTKADQLGIKNITFKQADILKISEAGQTFDFIATSGVLHHLRNPLDGWAALVSVLKPKGLMRVALYSARARWAVNDAKAVIAKKGYVRNEDDIRRFRNDARSLLRSKTWKYLENYHDYYYLNEFCDMLFHVQDHEFTPLELAGAMDQLGLQFERFFTCGKVMEAYRKMFKDDPEGKILINWDKFEHKNPDTFRSMLQFWCRKK